MSHDTDTDKCRFLESLLNNSIRSHPMSLPELHLHVQHSGTSLFDNAYDMMHAEINNKHKKTHDTISPNKNRHNKVSTQSSSGTNRKLQQPTIFEMLRKGGAVSSKQLVHEDSSGQPLKSLNSADQESDSTEQLILEVPAASKALNAQRCKFRPLLMQCFSLLEFSKVSIGILTSAIDCNNMFLLVFAWHSRGFCFVCKLSTLGFYGLMWDMQSISLVLNRTENQN